MPERLKSTDIPAYFTKTFTSTFLLQEISQCETTESRHPFYRLRLRDADGTVSGTIWKECMKEGYPAMSGEIVTVKSLVAQDPDGRYSLIIREMSLCHEYDMSDYINGLREEERSKYMELLWRLIDSVGSVPLKALLKSIFSNIDNLEKYPATICGHHHFEGGFLVYTYSVACMSYRMALSLSQFNFSPSLRMAYNMDLLVAAALLHAVGTVRMLTPSPDAKRRESSIPLSLHELTVRHIQEAVCRMGSGAPDEDLLSLLFHIIGCVYESELRKPVLREALILKNAASLHDKVSLLEHFIAKNREKPGICYDSDLGNYIFIPKEAQNGENISGQ